MAQLGDIVDKVRSKNAGPFWLTVDIFCGDADRYAQVAAALSEDRVAGVFHQPVENVQRYDLPALHVVKFSMPRPVVQGSAADRDMHASQWGWLIAELEINA